LHLKPKRTCQASWIFHSHGHISKHLFNKQECSWPWTCLAWSNMDAYRQDNILCHFTILRWTPVIGYSFYWSHILIAYKSKQNTLAIAQDGYTMIEINPFSSSGKPCTMYNWKDGLNHKRIPRLVISL